MPSSLRAIAIAGCSALLVAGAATAASASTNAPAAPAPAFTVHPSWAQVGKTVTLTGADFTSTTSVTFHGVAATPTHSGANLQVVVPIGATSGPVIAHQADSSTLRGPRFTVQQVAAGAASASKSVLTFGQPLLVRGRERVASTGDPVVGQSAVLLHRVGKSGKWHRAKGTDVEPTGKQGGVQWRVKPRANSGYRVYFRQSHEFTRVLTGTHTLRVLPRVHVRSLNSAPALSTSHISGGIHPQLGGKVFLQRNTGGHWQTVKHQKLQAGQFSFAIKPSSVGRLQYRVVRRSDAKHGAATSRSLHIVVVHRTLSLGDSGRDVKALQRRLHKLHYDIGPRNGSYGYDTLHAVTAFEKVNGLDKDGQAGPAVWKKLNNPKRYHLRHPDSSENLAVEVNLHKQVLILARNGKVWRILDTSTAGGYYFTNSEGEQEQAITPTGHFTIQYKLTGWHKSDLGELYYPSYFTNTGYAIHGEGNGNGGDNVPPYPNSHGCVRITNNAVLRYFDDLTVGTSVWIYG